MIDRTADGGYNFDNGVVVTIAHGLDDLCRVMAIRAAVFMGEEDCDFDDEFDGNDLCATHLIAYREGEPVGTFRIRWFSEFARFERLAIRKRSRSLHLVNALVASAMEVSRQKGYRFATGLARDELVKFWKRHGGYPSGKTIKTSVGDLTPIILPLLREGQNEPSLFSLDEAGSEIMEQLLLDREGCWTREVTDHAA
ncbi:MAG: GNAT family N-acetyltransferase [Azospirillaceae bacterium]